LGIPEQGAQASSAFPYDGDSTLICVPCLGFEWISKFPFISRTRSLHGRNTEPRGTCQRVNRKSGTPVLDAQADPARRRGGTAHSAGPRQE
jgi:hypothetical protein